MAAKKKTKSKVNEAGNYTKRIILKTALFIKEGCTRCLMESFIQVRHIQKAVKGFFI